MSDHPPIEAHLMAELTALRRRVAQLEAAEIERKRVEQSLRENEQLLQTALRAAQIYLWHWDISSDELRLQHYFNPSPKIGTYSSFLEQVHPEDGDKIRQAVSRAFEEGLPYHAEYRDFTRQGETRWNISRGVLQYDEVGRPLSLIGVEQDITEQKQAEAALRASEEKFNKAFHSSPAAMAITNLPAGQFIEVNHNFLRMTGYSREEVLHRTPGELNLWRHSEERDQLWEQFTTQGFLREYEFSFRSRSGEIGVALISVEVIELNGEQCGLCSIHNITERKHMEEQLRQAQKMEAVGRLAGGVAHDFNNLLTVIFGNCAFLLDNLEPGHPRRHDAEQIQTAAERAASLTRQLLAFSRKQHLQPQLLNLNLVIANLEKILSRLIGEDVELVTRLEPNLGLVKADPGQLEQVLLNLAVNARDAMPQGGKLIFETTNIYLDTAYTQQHFGRRAGPHLLLTVSDTGVGMDAMTREHIFEPFFTTKETGKGTGLGLATVHGIINQSGGHIWVYSEPGYGTTFKIYLPQVEGIVTPAEPEFTPVRTLPVSATILLVEDEKLLREVAERSLEENGYHVLVAENSQIALQYADDYQNAIDLLLADVIMPGGMNGPQLAKVLTSRWPALKVIYMSGYTNDMIAFYEVLESGLNFLQKPFTPKTLMGKVQDLLDS
jgi:two-component system, cell cycle sensor histidine kinase and response regulator CckA